MTARTRRPEPRGWAAAGLLAACLLGTSCYQDPVVETLDLRMLPGDGFAATNRVLLRDEDANDALKQRLARLREDLVARRDPWAKRLPPERCPRARVTEDWRDGELVELRRDVACPSLDALAPLFADTDVDVVVTRGEESVEVSLVAGRSTRATRDQRERVEELEEPWKESMAAYVMSCARLYDHFEAHPDRAMPCLIDLLGELAPKVEAEPGEPPVSDEETALVEPVEASLGEVLDLMEGDEQGGFSFEELSDLVHDPYPADVRLRLSGEPLEVEGFRTEDGWLVVPRASPWNAVLTLQGRWLEPDLAARLGQHLRAHPDGNTPFDLAAFVALPRRVTPPRDASEVVAAVDSTLQPVHECRVRWKPADAELDVAHAAWPELLGDEPPR
jgi:hypothetical protein